MTKEEYFDALRFRWRHGTLLNAALMTYLLEAKSDADADAQLRLSGAATLDRMVKSGVLRRDMTVYEIGCGCGRVATALVDYLSSGRYVGVDLSPEYVRICNWRIPHGGFCVTDGYSFPLPDASADLVIEFSIFCHMPIHQVWKWLLECRRVLRPDGKTYVQFHNLASPNGWEEFERTADSWAFVEDLGHPRTITWDAVLLLMEKAGLQVERAEEIAGEAGNPHSWMVIASPMAEPQVWKEFSTPPAPAIVAVPRGPRWTRVWNSFWRKP